MAINPVSYFGFQSSSKKQTSPSQTSITVTKNKTLKQSIEESYGKNYVVNKASDGSFIVNAVPVEYTKYYNKNEPNQKQIDTYSPHTVKISPSGRVIEENYQKVYNRSASKNTRVKDVYTDRYVNYSTGVDRQYKTRGVGNYGRETIRLSYERKASGQTRDFSVVSQDQERRELAGQIETAQGRPLSTEQKQIIMAQGIKGLDTESFKKAAPKQTYTPSEFAALKSAEKKARVQTLLMQQSAVREYKTRFNILSDKVSRYQEFKNAKQSQSVYYTLPTTTKPSQFKPLSSAKNFVSKSYYSASNFFKSKQGDIVEGAKYGLKTTGYVLGTPFVFFGQQIEKFGSYYEKNPIGQDKSGAGIKAVGQFTTGYGKGFTEKPTTSLISLGVGSVIGFGIPAVKGVVGTAFKASRIPIAASVAKYVPKTIEAGAVLGFGGVYAVDIGKRVAVSEKPYETFGSISSSELTSLAAGAKTGEIAYEGVKNLGVRLGSTKVAASTLVDPKVLSGDKTFPTSKSGAESLKQFESQRDSAGNIRTFHATTSSFSKETTVKGIEAGAGSDKALGKVMRNIKTLHLEGKTVKQISKSTGKSAKFVKSTLSETEGLFVAPTLSTHFLRVAEVPKTVRYSLTSESAGNPSALSIRVGEVKRVPAEIRDLQGTKAVSEGDVFLSKQAGKDTAFITPRSEKRFTVETEAVIPKGTEITRNIKNSDLISKTKGFSEYTVIEGRAVPIYEYKFTSIKQPKAESIKSAESIKDNSAFSEIQSKALSSEKYYTSKTRSPSSLISVRYSYVSPKSPTSSITTPASSSSSLQSSSYKIVPVLSSNIKYSKTSEPAAYSVPSRPVSRRSFSSSSSRPPVSRQSYSASSSSSRLSYSRPAIKETTKSTPFILDIPDTKPVVKQSLKKPISKRVFTYNPTLYSLATGTKAKLSKKKKRQQSLSGLGIRPIGV